MQRHWIDEELALYWSLATNELAVLPPGDTSSRLGVALSLKFCQLEGRFPRAAKELPLVAVQYVAKQLDVDPALATAYDWQGRTGTRYRRHLRLFLGMRPATVADVKALETWLRTEMVPGDHDLRHLQAAVLGWCHEHHLEPPSAGRVERVLRSLVRTHEHEVCTRVAAALLPATRTALDALLMPGPGGATEEETAEVLPLVRQTPFSVLKGDPGRVGLKSVLHELDKLRQLEALQLPTSLETLLPPHLLRRYRLRVAAEPPREVRQHPEALRYTLLAAFCGQRRHEIIDGLMDLLIQIVHRITIRAEKKVVQELLGDLHKVRGKTTLLFQLAEAAVDRPDGTVREVLYPVVSEQRLRELVKEYRARGPAYHQQVYTILRASYSGHYRRMLPPLLETLAFQTTSVAAQPILTALERLKAERDSRQQYWAVDGSLPDAGTHLLR